MTEREQILLSTFPPGYAVDSLEFQIGGVDGHEILGILAYRRDANLGVYIEETLLAARRPDQRFNTQIVMFYIIVLIGAFESRHKAGLHFRSQHVS